MQKIAISSLGLLKATINVKLYNIDKTDLLIEGFFFACTLRRHSFDQNVFV